MVLNHDLVARLRSLASSGDSVATMIDEIGKHLREGASSPLIVDKYLMEAFNLQLGQVRVVEGSSRFGSKAYSDEDIDKALLPLIEANRHVWETDRS